MSYYHLTWDAKTDKHPNLIRDLIKLLCADPFNAKGIGRPVESTIIFRMNGRRKDVGDLYDAIRGKFKVGFDFVVSRVAYTDWDDEKNGYYIRGKGISSHQDACAEDLEAMRKDSVIPQDVVCLYLVDGVLKVRTK